MALEPDLPHFDESTFGRDGSAFVFDLASLHGRSDIPRPFLHRHGYYHLLWMSQAQGQHVLDFESFEVRPHSVFFISPGQVHAWTSSVPTAGYVLNFSVEFFQQMFPRADEVAGLPFFQFTNAAPVLYLTPDQHAALHPLLQDMEREFGSDLPGQQDVVRSLLLILLTRLGRLHPPRDVDLARPKSYALAQRFKLLVDRHYLAWPSLRDYAQALLVTESRLNVAVKSATGKTASQLINERTVLEAKRLLTQSELAISEIAYRLNFDDPAYFSRFFKKHAKATPGDFKKAFAGPLA